MTGIYGIFTDSIDVDFPYYHYMFSSKFENIINNQYILGNHAVIGRSSLNKFQDDRFVSWKDKSFYMNEGVLLNYNRVDLPEAFINDLQKKGSQFYTDLTGSYSGVISTNNGKNICLYNDFMGTRPLYYYHDSENLLFIFSSELKFFPSIFKKMGLYYEPNELAWSELSVNGYLFGNHTLIKNVHKLPRNSLLHWDYRTNSLTIKSQGDNLQSFKEYENDKELFDDIESYLVRIITLSREKDISYGYDHFQALSGGLDSRLNSGIAQHLGYTNSHTLTFTQSGTNEEACARAFGRYMKLKNEVIYLDDGNYFESDLMAAGLANDCLVKIHGAAQIYHCIRNFVRETHGMFHSGQIGGVVFGSYFKWNKPVYEMIRKQAFFRNDAVFDYYFKDDKRILKYNNYGRKAFAMFSLEERMVNSTFNGDICCYHFTDTYSPFVDRNIVNLMYTQSTNKMSGQKIYFKFLMDRLPFILKTRIDRSFFYPTNYYRYKMGNYLMRLWKKIKRDEDMNPYQVWFEQNSQLRHYLDVQYKLLNSMYSDQPLLKKLTRFDEKSFHGYLQPLTLLLAYDTHFGEQKILNMLKNKDSTLKS